METLYIPSTDKKRVVIIGGGFGGLALAQKLKRNNFQIILLDKNNYHQFPPLLYQVGMSGLEVSAILFPFRRLFQSRNDFHFRLTEVTAVHPGNNTVETKLGSFDYDYLVIAAGTKSNFFNIESIQKNALPMKTAEDALAMRNHILSNFEKAAASGREKRAALLHIVIAGGGPTGVEIAGALAEMRENILHKDYSELSPKDMQITLVEGSDRLLMAMSKNASEKSLKFLQKMGVDVRLNTFVKAYENGKVQINDNEEIETQTLIWTSGVTANTFEGLDSKLIGRAGRINVDAYNRVQGSENIFAIGDIALQTTDSEFPNGHPQLAQVAIQQGRHLAMNMNNLQNGNSLETFSYFDKGSMATIGRNKAVVDLKHWKFSGMFAWFIWMFIHLISILGVKNRIFVFWNWVWSYLTYDQPLRLIIRRIGKQ